MCHSLKFLDRYYSVMIQDKTFSWMCGLRLYAYFHSFLCSNNFVSFLMLPSKVFCVWLTFITYGLHILVILIDGLPIALLLSYNHLILFTDIGGGSFYEVGGRGLAPDTSTSHACLPKVTVATHYNRRPLLLFIWH